VFSVELPTKVISELIMDKKSFYETGTNGNMGYYVVVFQKLTKTFSYINE
jgi:hypothetical protein